MSQATVQATVNTKKQKVTSESPWRSALRRFRRNKLGIFGLAALVFMILFSFVGPLINPWGPEDMDVRNMNKPPSWDHWLGTDNLGRDVLERTMEAGQISLLVGIVATAVIVILGATIGAVAGYYGRWVDTILMRFADIMYAVPTLPILITLGAVFSDLKIPPQSRIYYVMFIIGIISWMSLARLVRSQILSFREQEFMLATEVLGLRDRRKIFGHLLPNTVPIIIVVATLNVAGAILLESTLSFLGLGVIPPTPSWGYMLSAANNMIDFSQRPWLWIPPGVCILITVVSINFIGDALRDAFDPKQKR